ncbi:MAG: hypothetical protein IJC56_05840 [Clostridia bacterium]|nr:hypothetical protein [Clostridia bacterium]
MGLGWILLLTVIALILIIVASCWYFSWLMQKLLYNKVEDIEYIRAYSMPPDRWQRKFLMKARKAGKIDPEDQKKQTKKNLRNLEKLIKFAETTRFMEDEGVRNEVLLVLKLVKREWKDSLDGNYSMYGYNR